MLKIKTLSKFKVKDNRLFVFGLLSGYTVFILTTLGSIFLIPYVLRYLTENEYGAYTLLLELFGWLIVTDLGVVSVFNSKGAHFNGRLNDKELTSWFNTVFFSQLISALIPFLALMVFGLSWPIFLGAEVMKIEGIVALILLLSLSFLIDYVSRPLRSLLLVRKKIYQINIIELLFFFIRFILILICLYLDYGMVSFGVATITARLFAVTLAAVLTRRDLWRLKPKYFDKGVLKYLFGNGLWITLGGLAGILILRTDSFLINRYLTLSLVGTFYLNKRLWDYAEKLHSKYLDTYRPFLSNIYGQESNLRFNETSINLQITSLLLSLIIGSGVYFLSEIFITIIADESYYLGGTMSALFFIQFLVQSNVLPLRIILATSLYKVRKHNLSRIFEGLMKVLFSIILLKSIGLKGLIIASIATSLLSSHIILRRYVGQLISLKTVFIFIPIIVLILGLTVMLTISSDYERMIVALTIIMIGIVLWKLISKNNKTLRGLMIIQ